MGVNLPLTLMKDYFAVEILSISLRHIEGVS